MKGFWKRKLPACLLALALMVSAVPMASAVSADLTYDVEEDDYVYIGVDDFEDFFYEESWYDDELYYLEFTDVDDFDDYGYFTADDEDGDNVSLDTTDLYYGYFFADGRYARDSDEYDLDTLYFETYDDVDSDTLYFDFTLYGWDDEEVDGTMRIDVSGSYGGSGDVELTYYVDPGDDVTVDAEEFWDLFDEESRDYFYYLEFTDYDDFDDYGVFYAEDYYYDEVSFDYSDLEDGEFYYDEDEVSSRSDEFDLDTLTFEADRYADEDTLAFDFTMWGEDDDWVEGTLYIEIGDGKGTSGSVKADFVYQVDPDDDVVLDAEDFYDYFWDESDYDELEYIEFTDYDDFDDYGWFEADGYDYDDYVRGCELNDSDLDDAEFYYDEDDAWDDYEFELDTLTFCTERDADEDVLTFDVTMHGVDGDKIYATLAIEIGDAGSGAGEAEGGDIRYSATFGGRVQINANDIARFFQESYPGYTLQYVTIDAAPETGTLYYNYYGTSRYGTSYNMRLTDALCEELDFYFSPSSSQYALSELTYVPSGVNYCAQIPFTAHGSGSRSVSGTILISVNLSEVPDVYGPTPMNTSVTFPAASISAAVNQASGLSLSGIQLLELPASNEGTVYVGSGTSNRADTDTVYGYSSGSERISQLRFVPASGFTGSVEIPYAAVNASGKLIASGKLCLGVVRQMEDFSDITSSTWCYKYVLELSDAGVIDGYENGTFRPDSQVTYGAALKLIMLAAGYTEQAPTGSNVFSGYLARAQEDGLVSGSVNLSAPITRLAVSQIAAKALGLSITNLSSVRPFTDTTDPYVQALNAAGIVEGYFSNGTSTFKPYNTLTRGQISAIVWRMEQL